MLFVDQPVAAVLNYKLNLFFNSGTVFLTLGCMYTLQPLVTLSIMMDRSQVPLSQSLYWLLKPIMFHFVFLFQVITEPDTQNIALNHFTLKLSTLQASILRGHFAIIYN